MPRKYASSALYYLGDFHFFVRFAVVIPVVSILVDDGLLLPI